MSLNIAENPISGMAWQEELREGKIPGTYHADIAIGAARESFTIPTLDIGHSINTSSQAPLVSDVVEKLWDGALQQNLPIFAYQMGGQCVIGINKTLLKAIEGAETSIYSDGKDWQRTDEHRLSLRSRPENPWQRIDLDERGSNLPVDVTIKGILKGTNEPFSASVSFIPYA